MTKYLLPCSCGEKIAIETSQAGQTVRCSCGKTVEAPTMQGIRRLEPSLDESAEAARPSSYGGTAVGTALIGLMIFLAGAGYTAWKHTQRPYLVDVDYMSPWDTWLMWQSLRDGVRLPEYSESPYLKALKEHREYMTVGIVVTVLGGILLACGGLTALLNRRSQGRRKKQRAP